MWPSHPHAFLKRLFYFENKRANGRDQQAALPLRESRGRTNRIGALPLDFMSASLDGRDRRPHYHQAYAKAFYLPPYLRRCA